MTVPVTHIALVDDQAMIRDGFEHILHSQPDLRVSIQASNGQELLDALDTTTVDVILLDLRMPVLDGLGVLRQLARQPKPPPVLVVTTFDRDDLVLDALAAGARGYILKRARAPELLEAVRIIAAGGSTLTPDVTATVLSRLRTVGTGTTVNLDQFQLTRREIEILALIGAGLNNTEISDRLYLSVHTVKTHLTSILTKTHSRDRIHAALLARQAGLHPPN